MCHCLHPAKELVRNATNRKTPSLALVVADFLLALFWVYGLVRYGELMQQALQINIDDAKRKRDAAAIKKLNDEMLQIGELIKKNSSRTQKESKAAGSAANAESERDDDPSEAAGGGGAKSRLGDISDVMNPMIPTASASLEMVSLPPKTHVNVGVAPPFKADAASASATKSEGGKVPVESGGIKKDYPAVSASTIMERVGLIRAQHKFNDNLKVDEFLQKIAAASIKADSGDLKISEGVLRRLEIGLKLFTLIDEAKKFLQSKFQTLIEEWADEDVTWAASAAAATGDKEVGDKDKVKHERKSELDAAEEGVKAIKLLQNTAASMMPPEISPSDTSTENLLQKSIKTDSDPKYLFDPATDAIENAVVCCCGRF